MNTAAAPEGPFEIFLAVVKSLVIFKSRPVTYFLESQLISNLEFTGCRCVVPLTLHYVSPMCIMVFILLVWS